MEIIPLPCPFCSWKKIRVMETKSRTRAFKGSKYTYCWCNVCGTKGPWAWSTKETDKENYKDCVVRWNERTGEKQTSEEPT